MPANYYRIDLRLPVEICDDIEKLQREIYENSGRKLSKAAIIKEMIKVFLETPSRSCFSKREDT